jgi:uncharacterized protein HemX
MSPSDGDGSRPRLVSVSDDHAPPPAAEASEPAGRPASRWLLWLLAVLALAALAGLVAQTQRARMLQGENDALSGELFATRTALDAYVARFAEVRESIDGLQVQLEQLDALVSGDPLAPPSGAVSDPAAAAAAEPEPVSESAPELGD